MMHYMDESIVEGMRLRDNDVIQYVYKSHYPTIKYFVKLNNGDEEDVKDIFQEAIIIIYKKANNNELKLDCSFKTYLYSICRNLWLKELEKRRGRNLEVKDSEEFVNISDNSVEEMYEQNIRYKIFQQHASQLSEDCQKVLRLFLDKVPLKEIARIMGYAGEKYAKKRKFQCKEKLVENIKADANYQRLVSKNVNNENIKQVTT